MRVLCCALLVVCAVAKLDPKEAQLKANRESLIQEEIDLMWETWCKSPISSKTFCKDRNDARPDLGKEYWSMHEFFCAHNRHHDTSPCRELARHNKRQNVHGHGNNEL